MLEAHGVRIVVQFNQAVVQSDYCPRLKLEEEQKGRWEQGPQAP